MRTLVIFPILETTGYYYATASTILAGQNVISVVQDSSKKLGDSPNTTPFSVANLVTVTDTVMNANMIQM